MKKTINDEELKAQNLLENAMGDITRATRKILMDYVLGMYHISFAKAIAYLGSDSPEAKELLASMDAQTRQSVESAVQGFNKSDSTVVSEIEHILTSSGMHLENEYQKIKDNLLLSSHDFAETALNIFRKETPIFQDFLNQCIFDFEDLTMLDDISIQKIITNTDKVTQAKALKGTSKKLQEKFFRNMPSREASMLKEDMEWMGPVFASNVKAAQAKILKTAFQLEKDGKIIILNGNVSDLIY